MSSIIRLSNLILFLKESKKIYSNYFILCYALNLFRPIREFYARVVVVYVVVDVDVAFNCVR